MKEGRSLVDLARELERQANSKRDFLVRDDAMTMTVEERNPLPQSSFHMAFGEGLDYEMKDLAHAQVAEKLGISIRYYRKMLMEAPNLLGDNVNHWLKRSKDKRLVRCLDDKVRAFLSDRYRSIDNVDIAGAVLPVFMQRGLIVRSCEVTDTNLFIKVTSPEVQGEIRPGQLICAGVMVRNSEVSRGAFAIEEFYETLACTNGMRGKNLMRKYHVGEKLAAMLGDSKEVFRTETRKKSDEAMMMQVQDVVRATLSFDFFSQSLDKMRAAAGQQIRESADITKVVELTGKEFALTESEGSAVLRHLIQGGDLTKWGVASAVTRTAQDAETYDRASELESIGMDVVELPQHKWQAFQVN